jgi:ribosome-binding factor A
MEFDKHERVKSLLTEVVARFIREEANSDPMITITNMVVAKDYKKVKILFTTLPDGKEGDALIFLMRKSGELRSYIKKNARLKYIPHIDFEENRRTKNRRIKSPVFI